MSVYDTYSNSIQRNCDDDVLGCDSDTNESSLDSEPDIHTDRELLLEL